ncbi:LysR family transcriptional regulator substrate-binding protein [Streptomyces verrucosisporus]|uniref:LysR family transcriptional regulator substrate-binding protein n=1 Tax=Streptomyces verrucosisporus TaxID=1695161 RepID=UPI0019D30410|nr:LysR family transcriptional regulator substrate-binding protein [Streptomyces verrucosisporus]MBN3930077.1 LysR family transcriptional regulator substrate-binding protein [Streptomyces verrucosisporus]
MNRSEASPSFRLAYVPGVTPAKWVRIWNERLPGIPLDLVQVSAAEAPGVLRDGGADAGLLRLPTDRRDLSAIPLYTETTVVVVPKDHLVTAAEEVSAGELADEIVLHPLDDTLDWEHPPGRPALERPATTADAIELVAAGIGLLVVPQSLARLHHRRDLTYRPVTDTPQSRVALSWREDRTTDLVEDFIGIVRGRTVNSTRGRRPAVAGETKPGRRDGQDGAKPGRSDGAGARRKPAGGGQAGRGRGSGRSRGSGGGRRGRPHRRS